MSNEVLPSLESPAAYISANAASYIASTYTATVKGTKPPALTLDATCLRNLNAFLDYFLAIIIKEASSTDLHDLKATLARILDSALGYVALNEAQAELETYRNQETGAGRRFDQERPRQELEGAGAFDVEAIWLQARVRCMIYSTVGEKEESDFPTLTQGETHVTPPVAIFLTAILEFLGEHILLTSARFARDRIGSGSKGVLLEDDLDRGIRMDKVLGTIWQGYLAIVTGQQPRPRPAPNVGGTHRTDSNKVFTTLPFEQQADPLSPATRSNQNPDQYEQTPDDSDPGSTPVILRKASPAMGETAGDRRKDTTLEMHDSALSSSMADPAPLESILEAESSRSGSALDLRAHRQGNDTTKAASNPPIAPLNPARRVSVADSYYGDNLHQGQVTAPPLSRQDDIPRSSSLASSLYTARPTSGLWSRKESSAYSGGSIGEIQHATLWQRQSAAEANNAPGHGQEPNWTQISPLPTPQQNQSGFESGLFQWNARRETLPSQSPLMGYMMRDDASSPAASPTTLQIRAKEVSNLGDSPTDTATSALDSSQGNMQVRQLTPVFAARYPSRARLDNAKLVGQARDSSDGALRGLGLVEPGSDYEAFLREGQTRSATQMGGAGRGSPEARMRLARIVANREAALAEQGISPPSSPQNARERSMHNLRSVPPTPPLGFIPQSPRSKTSRPASGIASRDPAPSPGPSQTMLLAEFLRNTGPSRQTPRAVPLMSAAAASSLRSTSDTRPDATRPRKAVKSIGRQPIDSSSGGDESDERETGEESWDEALYGPRPRKEESLAEFLSNTSPPPAGTRQASVESTTTTTTAPGAMRLTTQFDMSRLGPVLIPQEEDVLIAGPAYTSPTSEKATTGLLDLKTASGGRLSPATTGSPSTAARPSSASRSLQQPKSPLTNGSAKANLVHSQQRAVSRHSSRLESLAAAKSEGGDGPDNVDGSDAEDDADDDDDSIYGQPRRKPERKESLAEFLRNTGPAADLDTASRRLPPNSTDQSPVSSRPLSRISKRLSSSFSLMKQRGPQQQQQAEEGTSTQTLPTRPNHRPLLP